MSEVRKVDLFDLIKKADLKQYNFYSENYTPEERKKFSPWIMMRYMSSSSGGNDLRNLLYVNEIVNKDFSIVLKNHPEFVFNLFCVTGTGKTDFHKYIAPPKGQRLIESLSNKFFRELFNEQYSDSEIEIMIKKFSKYDESIIREFARDLSWEAKDIEKLIKEINCI